MPPFTFHQSFVGSTYRFRGFIYIYILSLALITERFPGGNVLGLGWYGDLWKCLAEFMPGNNTVTQMTDSSGIEPRG